MCSEGPKSERLNTEFIQKPNKFAVRILDGQTSHVTFLETILNHWQSSKIKAFYFYLGRILCQMLYTLTCNYSFKNAKEHSKFAIILH